MIPYRIYGVGVDGHFTNSAIEVHLECDADAISFARPLDYAGVEIWAGTRLVECLGVAIKKLPCSQTLPKQEQAAGP